MEIEFKQGQKNSRHTKFDSSKKQLFYFLFSETKNTFHHSLFVFVFFFPATKLINSPDLAR